MYITPASNWQTLNLSESEIKFVKAVGKRAVLRQLVRSLSLSIPAAQTRLKLLVRKGALMLTPIELQPETATTGNQSCPESSDSDQLAS
jgi:hypothetical protein